MTGDMYEKNGALQQQANDFNFRFLIIYKLVQGEIKTENSQV
jgi:hypothetical protein